MFNRPRIIPCLLLENQDMVKTIKFKKPRYLGDVVNAVKIFNNKCVDELCILDIGATKNRTAPNMELLKDIASEAFMPLSYGGGINHIDQIQELFAIGYEKVILNTALIENPELIIQAVRLSGSQSVVASIDAKTDVFGKTTCWIKDGTEKVSLSPVELAKKAQELGAGEILLNSINCDGMMQGYDLKLIRQVTSAVTIPVIACGGAKNIHDLKSAIEEGGAHAAAAGSMFVYYGSQNAVLITFPDEKDLMEIGIYND